MHLLTELTGQWWWATCRACGAVPVITVHPSVTLCVFDLRYECSPRVNEQRRRRSTRQRTKDLTWWVTRTHARTHSHLHTGEHIHTHSHLHTGEHTHTYTYTHTWSPRCAHTHTHRWHTPKHIFVMLMSAGTFQPVMIMAINIENIKRIICIYSPSVIHELIHTMSYPLPCFG